MKGCCSFMWPAFFLCPTFDGSFYFDFFTKKPLKFPQSLHKYTACFQMILNPLDRSELVDNKLPVPADIPPLCPRQRHPVAPAGVPPQRRRCPPKFSARRAFYMETAQNSEQRPEGEKIIYQFAYPWLCTKMPYIFPMASPCPCTTCNIVMISLKREHILNYGST